jgi:hypothetical protein
LNNSKGTSLKTKTAAQESSIEDTINLDFDNQLAVDPSLLKEVAEKGFACRWINASKLKANYGFDSRQWSPYKRIQKPGALENNSFGFTDPEGFVRRGDLVLAVRPMAVHNASKARIANKNRTLASNQRKTAVDSIKQVFSEGGLAKDAKVHDGYDENE